MTFVISELIAFVVLDPEGEEAVPAVNIEGTWLPLMAADEERVATMRVHAQGIATTLGQPVLILRFSSREQIGVIEPEGYGR